MSMPRIRRTLFSQPFLNRLSLPSRKRATRRGMTRAALLLLALSLLSAVAVMRGLLSSNVASAQTSVQRLNAGGPQYTDTQTQVWQTDTAFAQNGSIYAPSSLSS